MQLAIALLDRSEIRSVELGGGQLTFATSPIASSAVRRSVSMPLTPVP